ncbi:MFS transporter [Nonomuraea rubra]
MSSTRVTKAAVIGSVIEFYDFTLFGLAAALIFNDQFFPAGSPVAGTLGAFATFAVGFFARPVGGFVFSHFGDRVGRKQMLVITLMLMGLSTAGIGLLPTYDSVGMLAPALLVLLRIAQGFGAGAEYVGALVMVSEAGDARRRGLWASLPGAGIFTGILLATLVFTGVSALPWFETWAWRVPFLLSLAGVGAGLFFRFRVEESQVFERARIRGLSRFPVLEVFKKQPRHLLIAFLANVPNAAIAYIIQVFVLSYVTRTLGLPATTGLVANVVASLAAIVVTPLFGALTDRVGRRPVWFGGAAFMTVFAFPMFWLVETERPVLVILAVTLGQSLGIASMFAAQASLYAELFETRYRYSGIAIAREWTAALSGGPAPFVAAALLAGSGGRSWPIALLLMICGAVSFVVILFAPETRRKELDEPVRVAEPALK